MRVVTIKVICNGIIGNVTMKTKSQEKNPPPPLPPSPKKKSFIICGFYIIVKFMIIKEIMHILYV